LNAVMRQPKSALDKLPRRLKRFVTQYVAGDTPANAMKLAGYSGLHPRVVGHKWLKRPEVQAAVAEETERLTAEVGIRQVTVLKQMHAIASVDPRKLVDEYGNQIPLHKLDEATAAAISAVEIESISSNGETGTRYKYKFWDKVKANDRLGQFVKLWEARATNVNVDARSVTVNMGAGTQEALQYLADLGRTIATIGPEEVTAPADQDRSVLPDPVCDGEAGRGASVDASADTGDADQP
jgi:phage terminase small subunit